MTQVPTNQSANPNQFGAAMGDDPREQEEEWEREGLLDPAWEKQQRKVCSGNKQNIRHCTLTGEPTGKISSNG